MELNGEFEPPLSLRVDLDDYARKLLQVGEVIAAVKNDNSIIGTIGFYCNDLENGCGYISYLGVARYMRSAGVGGALLDKCLEECRSIGMTLVTVRTRASNRAAMAIYRSRSFEAEAELSSADRIKLTLTLNS